MKLLRVILVVLVVIGFSRVKKRALTIKQYILSIKLYIVNMASLVVLHGYLLLGANERDLDLSINLIIVLFPDNRVG
jgi:hypothetical protein